MPYFSRVILYFTLTCFVGLTACLPDEGLDVSNIDAKVHIHRFDRAFFETDTSTFQDELSQLKNGTFAPFFSSQQSESFWRHQRTVDFMVELAKEAKRVFTDDSMLSGSTEQLWKHYRYIFPDAPVELTVYTYISGLDFDFPVIFVDSISTVFIALDLFLGNEHPAYAQQAEYLNTKHTTTYLPVVLGRSMISPLLRQMPSDLSLISEMIHHGKQLYTLNKLLPSISGQDLMRYSPKEWRFCVENERMVWRFMVEQDFLFDQRAELKRRFTEEAPFSKFYMEFDNETPGRIGRWIGWQIVDAYMQHHPEISLIELLQKTDHRKLFNESRYKP